MKRMVYRSVLLLLALPMAQAQTATSPTTLQQVANGWSGEQFATTLAAGSSTCPGGPNEYTIPKTAQAYRDVVAMALAAFTSGSSVIVKTDGSCFQNNRAVVLELRLIK